MAFPTIPTVAAGRVLSVLATNPAGTHTSPNLSSLTKSVGDLLLAIVIIYDGNSTNAEFSSWGGGFTEFGDFATTTTMGIGCAYKVSSGSETGTFTVTSADTSANDSCFFLLSIPEAGIPPQAPPPEAGSYVTNTSAAADPGSFDPAAWGIEDTLWIAVCGVGEVSTSGSWTGAASAPANYSDYADSGLSADVAGAVEGAVAFRQLRAASEDVGTFSVDVSNARNAAAVIAVPPVPQVTAIRKRDQTFPPGRLMPRQLVRETRGEAQAQTFEQVLDAVVTVVATMTKQVNKIMSAVVTTVATMTKEVGKILTAVVTTVATMVKSVGKIMDAVVTVVATLSSPAIFDKTLTAVVTVVATMERQVGKIMTAVVTTVATMTKEVGKILTAVVTVAATMTKSVGKIMGAVVTVVASLEALKVKEVIMSAVVTVNATMTKQVDKIMSATVTTVATMTKEVGKLMSATVTTVATMTRQVGKILSATVVVQATLAAPKIVAKTLTATVSVVASLVADFVPGGAAAVAKLRTLLGLGQ